MKADSKSIIVIVLSLVIFIGIFSAGCTSPQGGNQTTPVVTSQATTTPTPNATPTGNTTPHKPNELLIATTTSLYDTKLLDRVQDIYENETGIDLKITSQGTGIALQIAKRGDADLLLVHSPSQEKTFIDDGYGINQRCFAYNYFIIVGPKSDPAGIANLTPEAAFAKIRSLGMNGTPNVLFVSRGDQSGTHTAEQNIWTKAGFNYTNNVSNSGPWYLSVGKGMGETLVLASQKGAYTLSDEGTFLAFKSQLDLVPLITQGGSLLNRYSAIAVNPAKNPNVNIVQADRFINWLISDEGKQIVGSYGNETYGKSLFSSLKPGVCNTTPFNCTCSGNVTPI